MRITSLFLFSSLLSSTALAAPTPHIIINATRTPTSIDKIASAVTVVDAQEIVRKNKPTVAELLRETPGITVANNGGAGQTTRVFMRGTNSNHVLVVMDGVRLNDPSDPGDAFDFSNLTTDNIERIEILRGPQSTLYGSQALGGVINIVSKKGEGSMKANGFAEAGRYTTGKTGAGVSGELGRTSYSVQGSASHSKGISSFDRKYGGREKDGSDMYTLAANVESALAEALKTKISARYNQNVTEFDSPGGFTRPNDDNGPENDSRQLNLRASGELTLAEGRWKQELGLSTLHLNRTQITEYFDSLGTPFFGHQQQIGRRDTVDWLHHVKLWGEQSVTVGAELWSDHFKTSSLKEVNVDNRAVFVDVPVQLLDNLLFGVSGRVDDHQAFGRQWTWKLAPLYTVTQTGTKLRASVGKGFKAPSLSQLYDPGYGNVSLKPEESMGYDVGFEQPFLDGRVTLSATAFRNDITNLIGFSNAPPFAGINVGKARTEGVESGIEFLATPTLKLHASHVLTLTEDRSNSKQLVRRPSQQATLGASYDYNDALQLDANARYSSVRKDIDFAFPFGRVDVKAATVLDFSGNYKLTENASLYARLDNVLDKRYEEVYGYGQSGRALYVGVKLTSLDVQ